MSPDVSYDLSGLHPALLWLGHYTLNTNGLWLIIVPRKTTKEFSCGWINGWQLFLYTNQKTCNYL